ncbi:MAG TPA: tripartite tricarboxylate transporter substrate binding protein [Burkholderiales bacterium]|nr:tripartite tricarboxylate transporter substrate binding protein [Burkholderiales bacterium]
MSTLTKAYFLANALLVSVAATAQTYPQKPIRLIVPTAPGGANDILARAIGPRLTDVWRQPVVVDNRAGGGGTIGAALVARAKPDGYTLVLGSISHIAIAPNIFPQKPYDPEKDFAPVIQLVDQPVVLAAHPSFPGRTVQDVISFARSKREELIYGSPGIGSVMHLAGEMLQDRAGLRLLHVPYKGGGPAVIELIGGQVPLLFVGLAPALPHIRSGRIRAIAVAGARRASVLPDLPTIGETLPGYQVNFWAGVLAPAGTSSTIVNQLNREIVKILRTPAVNQQLRDASFDIIAGTPHQFSAAIRDDVRRWVPVVRVASIKPE